MFIDILDKELKMIIKDVYLKDKDITSLFEYDTNKFIICAQRTEAIYLLDRNK